MIHEKVHLYFFKWDRVLSGFKLKKWQIQFKATLLNVDCPTPNQVLRSKDKCELQIYKKLTHQQSRGSLVRKTQENYVLQKEKETNFQWYINKNTTCRYWTKCSAVFGTNTSVSLLHIFWQKYTVKTKNQESDKNARILQTFFVIVFFLNEDL